MSPVTPDTSPPHDTPMSPLSPPPMLTLNEAANRLGISTRTLQRRRETLTKHGAYRDHTGWHIPETALTALTDTGHASPPVTPDTSPPNQTPVTPNVTPVSPPNQAELERLKEELAAATADAREWRARAEERDRERTQLLERAHAAETTAREATATAAALALTLKQLETPASHTASPDAPRQDEDLNEPAPAPEPAGERSAPSESRHQSHWHRARNVWNRMTAKN